MIWLVDLFSIIEDIQIVKIDGVKVIYIILYIYIIPSSTVVLGGAPTFPLSPLTPISMMHGKSPYFELV